MAKRPNGSLAEDALAREPSDAVVEHGPEWRDPTTLKPHPRNSRKHSTAQIDQLAASLEKFGFTKPVLVDDDDTIIAGHGSVRAALQIGMGKIPVVVARGWSDDDKRAYLVADNRLGEKSRWDHELLSIELGHLKKIGGGDLTALGFSKAELSTMVRKGNAPGGATSELGPGLHYSVIVECGGEREQASLLERFAKEGLKCRALIS